MSKTDFEEHLKRCDEPEYASWDEALRQAQMRADVLQRSDDMHRRRHGLDRSTTPESLSGCRLPATGTGAWAPIADPATQPVYVTAYAGGGRGGHGDLALAAYRKDVTAEWCEPHDAHVRARADWPTEPAQPERRYCACGQELREVLSKRRDSRCGDCRASVAKGETQLGEVVRPASLDARIAAAQPKAVDADPTQAWGAGATPGYDWEGT